MGSSVNLGKISGWLLAVGTGAHIVTAMIRPGNFVSDPPEGPTGAMLATVRDIVANTELYHVATELSLLAFAVYMLGVLGVEQRLRDGSGAGLLRKAGSVLVLISAALWAVSYATGHMMATVLTHASPEALASGQAFDSGVTIAAVSGGAGVFGSLANTVGLALLALGMMNFSLLGADKQLAMLLAVVPAVGAVAFVIIGSHVTGSVVTVYLVGNLLILVQALWAILLGVALIRKSDSLPAAAG